MSACRQSEVRDTETWKRLIALRDRDRKELEERFSPEIVAAFDAVSAEWKRAMLYGDSAVEVEWEEVKR